MRAQPTVDDNAASAAVDMSAWQGLQAERGVATEPTTGADFAAVNVTRGVPRVTHSHARLPAMRPSDFARTYELHEVIGYFTQVGDRVRNVRITLPPRPAR